MLVVGTRSRRCAANGKVVGAMSEPLQPVYCTTTTAETIMSAICELRSSTSQCHTFSTTHAACTDLILKCCSSRRSTNGERCFRAGKCDGLEIEMWGLAVWARDNRIQRDAMHSMSDDASIMFFTTPHVKG